MHFTSTVFLLSLGAASLQAQEPWKTSYYPYLLSTPSTGLQLVAHWQRGQAADYFDRVPFAGSVSVEGGLSAQGSRFGTVRFKAPRLVEGWRFTAGAGAVREGRYGFTSGTVLTPPPAGAGEDLRERVHRSRYSVRGDVTRRLAGPLQVALGGHLQHTEWTRVPGASEFRTAFGDALGETDLMGRLALVLDTRDKEFVTANGVFVEAGLYGGTGGDGYRGAYGIARGYVSPRDGTVLAARLGARSLGGTPSLDAENTIPTWEEPTDVLGGDRSHRSFVPGQFHGRGVLLANAEIRHDLLNAGDYGAITLLVFVDGGRVFADEFEFTTEDWEIGGGGGVALRILRSTLLTFNFAGGPDGFRFTMGTGWAF